MQAGEDKHPAQNRQGFLGEVNLDRLVRAALRPRHEDGLPELQLRVCGATAPGTRDFFAIFHDGESQLQAGTDVLDVAGKHLEEEIVSVDRTDQTANVLRTIDDISFRI